MPLHYILSDQVNHSSTALHPPLVLLHGLFGSLDNLNGIKTSQQHDHQILSIDLPNHGRSPHQAQFNYQTMSDAVLGLLEELAIEQCYLLGHSMGGKVAMQIALIRPQLVKKLIVADIAPVAYPSRHNQVLTGLEAIDLASITSRRQADQLLAQHIMEPGVRAFLLKSLEISPQGNRWRFNLTAIQACYPQLTQAITANQTYQGQTLFIKGSQSDYIQTAHRATITQLFPNSQAHIIQNTGHWLHAEKPIAFNRVVSNFLKK